MTPAEILPALLRQDAARPRITYYDDTDEPTRGERIELSARVLNNWVSKAGNLLQDELDVAPGVRVALDLPADHWRTMYWALAVWAVGATVTDEHRSGDVLVSTVARDLPDPQVLVTLAALARTGADVPAGVVDEAAELSTHGDTFTAYEEAAADDVALDSAAGSWTYADLVRPVEGAHRQLVRGDLSQVLQESLALWAGDGSVLLCRGEGTDLTARLASEGARPTP